MVSVWFAGVSWWQRPDGYYTHRRSGRYLHREVYEQARGPIPAGHDVHHRDGDPENNNPDNLEVLPRGEHRRQHATGKTKTPEQRAVMLANSKRAWDALPPRDVACCQCGEVFQTRGWGKPRAFCGAVCLERWRSDAFAGERRVCRCCGAEFDAATPQQVFCSRRCNNKADRPPVDRSPKPCAHCGTVFVPKRGNAKFCKRPCAVAGSRRERRKVANARSGL